MKKMLGFKVYKKDEDTFIQMIILMSVLLIGFIFIDSPETRLTILIMELALLLFIFTSVLKR